MTERAKPLQRPTRPAQFAALDLIEVLVTSYGQPGWLYDARDEIAGAMENFAAGEPMRDGGKE